MPLLIQALTKFLAGLLIVALMLFVPAGTLDYWQAWLFIAVLFGPMLVMGVVLMCRNPELLRKRLSAKEREGEQKSVVLMSSLLFVAVFVTAGLNHRFGWWPLPDGVVIAAAITFFLGYVMYAEVMRENVWLSRTVEVQEQQQVIDTGLYGIVRHPMYTATLILFLAIPLILASPCSFLLMLLYIPLVIMRIHNEETILAQSLPGYCDYMNRTAYRLIPWVW